MVALATHGTFGKLATAPLIRSMQRSVARGLVPAAARGQVAKRLLPVARQGMVKAVVQKPVYAVGTAAVATCAGAAPLLGWGWGWVRGRVIGLEMSYWCRIWGR